MRSHLEPAAAGSTILDASSIETALRNPSFEVHHPITGDNHLRRLSIAEIVSDRQAAPTIVS